MHDALSRSDALAMLVDLTAADSRDRAELEAILNVIDPLPATLRSVAVAIIDDGLGKVRVRLEHDLLGEVLDPSDYGFDWEVFDPVMRGVLCAASVCEGGCDREALRGISNHEVSDEVVEALCEGGLLVQDARHTLSMRWSARMLVGRHIEDRRAWQDRHASYFIERLKDTHSGFLPFEDVNLGQIFEYGMRHDADVAVRALLILTKSRRNSASLDELLQMFELVNARRPCVPGDLLGIELLGRRGEILRLCHRFEQSVEALELAITLGPPEDHTLHGGIHMALALTLSHMRRFEQALRACRVAVDCYTALGLELHKEDALAAMATILIRMGEYAEAMEVFDQITLQNKWINKSGVALLMGDRVRGRAIIEEGLAEGLCVDEPRRELIVMNNLTYLELLDEDEEAARQRVERIEELCEMLGSQIYSSIYARVARALYLQRYGSLLEAYHVISEVIDLDADRYEAFAIRAALAAHIGNMDDAREDIARLRAHSTHSRHRDVLVRYTRLAIRFNAIESQPKEHAEFIEALDAEALDGQWCLVQLLFMDLRQRAELLRDPGAMLWVEEGVRSARRGDRDEVLDLRKSKVARILLETLIATHRDEPGQICTTDLLFEAAWPGQVWNESARTRFHTAIHRLRDRLLGDLLVTHSEEGYSLRPHCRVMTTPFKKADVR